MQINAKQCKAMQSNAQQCKAMQSNAKQCKAMQSNAMQDRTRLDWTRLYKARLDYSTLRCLRDRYGGGAHHRHPLRVVEALQHHRTPAAQRGRPLGARRLDHGLEELRLA